MNDESDEEDLENKYKKSQNSKESTDSIDGDPDKYIQNDNFFALARQINKGIIIRDKENKKDVPVCSSGKT